MTDHGSFETMHMVPGPMRDEVDDRFNEMNLLSQVVEGHMIPVRVLPMIAEMVEAIEAHDNPPAVVPVIDGLDPVALLWRNDCTDPSHGHDPLNPQWHLVPLLTFREIGGPEDVLAAVTAFTEALNSAVDRSAEHGNNA